MSSCAGLKYNGQIFLGSGVPIGRNLEKGELKDFNTHKTVVRQ